VLSGSTSVLADPKAVGKLIGACDLLIVDHYGLNACWETPMRQWAKRILVIDDLADRTHDCDVLLDQNAGRTVNDYAGLVPPYAALLIGTRFALLRPQFAALRPASLNRRHEQPARRLLISLGLSDPRNLTSLVLDKLADAAVATELDIVLGSSAPFLRAVREKVTRMPSASLAVDVAFMAERMAAADLAVGAAGSSSWERCCMGLPTIVMIAADNQRLAAHSLALAGAVMLLDEAEYGTVASCVQTLLADQALRLRMAKAAAAICDGLGAQNVSNAIGAL
jgi:UDP-2,4-diacetamido-2,4,6-trideoxy-beta-L-altropyranose hydrolase